MRLTIGMPSYNNFTEVSYTVQALRMYHNLKDCEILVVDNFGDLVLENFVKNNGAGQVRYVKYTEKVGTSCAKNKVFEQARGTMVLCMDSHILLKPGALDNLPVTDDLVQGPMLYNDLKNYGWRWDPVWRGHMWGIWGPYGPSVPKEPCEIWGMGGGVLLAKKDTWLGFNPRFRGFGGEEGYIHEKYRKAGRKVICWPTLAWVHQFDGKRVVYPLRLTDKVRNYLIGLEELGIDPQPMMDHFGQKAVDDAKKIIAAEAAAKPAIAPAVAAKPAPVPGPSAGPLISCLCITYGRPHLLEEAIESFLRQDYPNKELIIVNDLEDQTLDFTHPNVQVHNLKERFATIGEKRNKSVELSHGDILVCWDDDDISLPWRLSQVAKAFRDNPGLGYFKPDKAWCYHGAELKRPHYNMFYMMAAFTRGALAGVGGYQAMNFGEDTDACERLIKQLGPARAKTLPFREDEYAFIYGWRGESFHLSAFGSDKDSVVKNLAKTEKYIKARPIESIVSLKPHWRQDYLKMTRDILMPQRTPVLQGKSIPHGNPAPHKKMEILKQPAGNGLPPGWFGEGDCKVLAELASKVPAGGIIVEVGSFLGRSSVVLSRAAPMATVVCIDPWVNFGVGEPGRSCICGDLADIDRQVQDVYGSFLENTKNCPNITVLRRFSPVDDWHNSDGTVDLVFLDGDHRREGMLKDLAFARRLLKPGGTVAGHDYNGECQELTKAVDEFAAGKQVRKQTGSSVWSVET